MANIEQMFDVFVTDVEGKKYTFIIGAEEAEELLSNLEVYLRQ